MVLAAGEGSRFDPSGVRYKLAQQFDAGRSIVRAACEHLFMASDEVLVVDGHRAAELDASLAGLPVRRAVCRDAHLGMGASIRCGVHSSEPSVGWLIALGDMPCVMPSTIKEIAAALREGAAIARPYFDGRPGHPVGFSSRLREGLLRLDPENGAAPLIAKYSAQVRRLQVEDPGCIADVDRPGDLGVW